MAKTTSHKFLRVWTSVVNSAGQHLRPEHIVGADTEPHIVQWRIPMKVDIPEKFDYNDPDTHPRLYLLLRHTQVRLAIDDRDDIENLYSQLRVQTASQDLGDPDVVMQVDTELTDRLPELHLMGDNMLEAVSGMALHTSAVKVVSTVKRYGAAGMEPAEMYRHPLLVSDVIHMLLTRQLYAMHEFRQLPRWLSHDWDSGLQEPKSWLTQRYPEIWTGADKRPVMFLLPRPVNILDFDSLEAIKAPIFLERSYCGYKFGRYTGEPELLEEAIAAVHSGPLVVHNQGLEWSARGNDAAYQTHESCGYPWGDVHCLQKPYFLSLPDKRPLDPLTRLVPVVQDIPLGESKKMGPQMDSEAYSNAADYLDSYSFDLYDDDGYKGVEEDEY